VPRVAPLMPAVKTFMPAHLFHVVATAEENFASVQKVQWKPSAPYSGSCREDAPAATLPFHD